MRASLRLLASASRFLEPGSATGLTGLLTHANPRSALIYTYHSTLEKLKQLPESSVYRQSTEALTKHRLSIIEQVKPEGLEQWQERVRKTVEAHPEAFRTVGTQTNAKETNVVYKDHIRAGMDSEEFDDEPFRPPQPEGPRSESERANLGEAMKEDFRLQNALIPRIESEPPLSQEQVNEIEQSIGAGLIEEVVQVAQGESELVDRMIESKVWEDLEEKPVEGQWTYHERDRHTPTTQAR